MKLILTILTFCAATTSFAADVTFNVTGFRSERKFGNYLITIYLKEDGNAQVTYDPNRCDPTGRQCTRIAVHGWEGPIKVVSDHRPTDGSLLLQLSDRIQLEVGSGYNLENKVTYTALLLADPSNPDGPVSRVPLNADVFAEVR